MERFCITGRSSSHFTRVVLLMAHELEVPVELAVVREMTSVDPATYAGNPTRKMPVLERNGSTVFGAENICRVLAEATTARVVVWPEDLRSDLSRNAQEMVAHAMAAQAQLVFGTLVCKLPADNVFFTKGRAGLEGALGWLDEHVAAAIALLPKKRDVSFFEVMLFCLLEHLVFRGTLALERWPRLAAFARSFGERPSAIATAYMFDA